MRAPTLAEARRSPDGTRKICGLHIKSDGQIAAVWVSHDKDTDICVAYDTFKPDREVIAVAAEALKRRGKNIPISWPESGKQIADLLLEHGCNMITEPVKHNEQVMEATALDVWERMRTSRFRVKDHLEDWLEEFKTYQREDGGVPLDSHPLMNATLHAIARLDWARGKSIKQDNHPRIALV